MNGVSTTLVRREPELLDDEASRWPAEYTTIASMQRAQAERRYSASFFLTDRMCTIITWRAPRRPSEPGQDGDGRPTCSPSVNTTS